MRASAQNVRPQSRNGRSEWFAVVLGNDVAIKAYRDGEVTFPDGAVIASLHYRFVPSEEKNKAFGQAQSFVPGESHERSVHGQGLKEVHLDGRLKVTRWAMAPSVTLHAGRTFGWLTAGCTATFTMRPRPAPSAMRMPNSLNRHETEFDTTL